VNEWNQNRASIGISSKIASPLKADIYYMRQSNRKNGDWTDTNILGLNFKLAF
jgi:hypothetical protein